MPRQKCKKKSKPRGRPKKVDAVDWAPIFLKAIIGGEHVRDACKISNIDGTLPYHRRQTDLAFAAAWEEAGIIGTKALEEEASRRAFHGTLKPVYQKGEMVGLIREYSDTLLMFLLRARKPDTYRESIKHEYDGKLEITIKADDDFYSNRARLAAGELEDAENRRMACAEANGTPTPSLN